MDADQLDHLNQWTWRLGNHGYPERGQRIDGKYVKIMLHRYIMGLSPGDEREVDHKNGDVFDCRCENLRIVNEGDNQQNVIGRGGTSKYRGVALHKRTGRWEAYASLKGVRVHIGYYDDEERAARAASTFRKMTMPHTEER